MISTCSQCVSGLNTLTSLGADRSKSVKTAYQMLVQVWHPDRFSQLPNLRTQAEENTKTLNSAYDHLRSHIDLSKSILEHLTSSGHEESQSGNRPGSAQEDTSSANFSEDSTGPDLIIPFDKNLEELLAAAEEFMASGDYTAEDFVLHATVKKLSLLYLPCYLFDCRFDARWTASFGFDRFEQYTHWSRRYDSVLKRHVKEPETRTKVVTDWFVHSGSAPGNCSFGGYAGPRHLDYARRLVEATCYQSSHRSFSPAISRNAQSLSFSSSSEEVYSTSIKPRVMELVDHEVKSHAQGDRQRDWRWSTEINYDLATLYVPACHVQLLYAQQQYDVWLSGVRGGFCIGDEHPLDNVREKRARSVFRPIILAAVATLFVLAYLCFRHFYHSASGESLFNGKNCGYTLWLALVLACLYAIGSKRRSEVRNHSKSQLKRALAVRRAKQRFASAPDANEAVASKTEAEEGSFWARGDLDPAFLPALSFAGLAAILLPLFFLQTSGTAASADSLAIAQTQQATVPATPVQSTISREQSTVSTSQDMLSPEVADTTTDQKVTAPPVEASSADDSAQAHDVAKASSSDFDQATRSQIAETVHAWALAYQDNLPMHIASFYAKHIDRYFLQEDVDPNFVANNMIAWLRQGNRCIVQLQPKITDMQLDEQGEVTVHLTKHVVVTDVNGTQDRLIRSILVFTQEDDLWKISSERDFK